MNKILLSIASIMLATLFTHSAFALGKNTVAAVNGKNISQKQYKAYLKQRQAQNQNANQAPASRQTIIDELINREILLQEAKKLKLHKNKQILAQLEQQKSNLMIQLLLSKSPAAKPVSDKELKEVYDKQIGNTDPTEYKVRHILVKDQAKAKKLIEQLNDGASFEDTAKNESTDASAKDGGQLEWLTSVQMGADFSKAVEKLKKGTHTQKPVKTRYGFHIVKLDDSRKRERPKFEDVKDQIRPLILNKRLQNYVVKLREKAKIEVK